MFLTEAIQGRKYYRSNVISVKVLEIGSNFIVLESRSVLKEFRNASSADNDMFSLASNAKIGDTTTGRVRIDFFENDSLRVRFAQTDQVPENNTPMVAAPLPPATDCSFENCNEKTVIACGNLEVTICPDFYSLSVYNRKTGKTIVIGGAEKKHFNNRDSLNMGVCHIPGIENGLVTENFALSPQEAIYGFGEKFIKLNKVGQTIELNAEDGLGIGSARTYKNIPFYVSTNGYGVYFNHSAFMTFWVGSLYAGDISVAIEDDFLDYYVFTGSIKEIIANYTALTGKASMPPKWSFGYWQSKITYFTADEVLDIAENMHKNDIPCDLIHIDTGWFKNNWVCDFEFDTAPDRYGDPKVFTKKLADLGVHLSVWQLPYVIPNSRAYEEFMAVDGFVKTKDGEIFDFKSLRLAFLKFPGPIGIIDFTNPKAVEVYKELLRRLFRLGVRVIKTDFGESAPVDGVYFDGTPGYKMHNLYPLLYNKAAFEVNAEFYGEGIVWGRSAYAGSQRYPLYWGGDNSPNFENMIPQLAGGLSFGLSGFPFWSQDVGGFMGNTNDKLLIRWMQYSVLMSHIRIHGEGDRELYKFSDECIRICRDYLHLRYRLLPYLLGVSKESCRTMLPVTRALVVEYQDDPNVWNIEDQYLSGEYLLVAPVYTEENSRTLYLPKGVWTDWHSGERISGGKWITVDAPMDILPLYVKEGAIIPLGPEMNYTAQKEIDEIEVRIYPFEGNGVSTFTVFTGKTSTPIRYVAKDGFHTVTVAGSDIKINVVFKGNVESSQVHLEL